MLITPSTWPLGAAPADGLSAEDFAALLEYTRKVVVFGAGARLRFPHPRLTAALTKYRHRRGSHGHRRRLPHL